MISPAVQLFLVRFAIPSPPEVAAFLRGFAHEDRLELMAQLASAGVSPSIIAAAASMLIAKPNLGGLQGSSSIGIGSSPWQFLALASAAASGYHGVKRHNGSVGWGVLWFILGGTFPIVTPIIAVAQGYGKPKED